MQRVNNRLSPRIRCWRESRSAILQFARDPGQRWHETYVDQFPALEATFGPEQADERLHAMLRADGRNQDAVRFKPFSKRVRNLLHRGSHDDAVEFAGAWGNVEAVAHHHLDIVVAETLQPHPGTVGQRPVTLDREHLLTKPREDSGLVTGARADLEHPV